MKIFTKYFAKFKPFSISFSIFNLIFGKFFAKYCGKYSIKYCSRNTHFINTGSLENLLTFHHTNTKAPTEAFFQLRLELDFLVCISKTTICLMGRNWSCYTTKWDRDKRTFYMGLHYTIREFAVRFFIPNASSKWFVYVSWNCQLKTQKILTQRISIQQNTSVSTWSQDSGLAIIFPIRHTFS